MARGRVNYEPKVVNERLAVFARITDDAGHVWKAQGDTMRDAHHDILIQLE